MPISSRVILPKNKSVVLIGTVEAGSIKRGETAEVKGYGKRYKVNVQSMQIFHQQASMVGQTLHLKSYFQVKAGDHCGIQCKGLTDEDVIHKGMWMGKPGSIVTSNFVKIQFYLMSEEECPKLKAIKSGYQDMIYCGLWNQVAKLVFPVKTYAPKTAFRPLFSCPGSTRRPTCLSKTRSQLSRKPILCCANLIIVKLAMERSLKSINH